MSTAKHRRHPTVRDREGWRSAGDEGRADDHVREDGATEGGALCGRSYREVEDMPTFDTLPLNEARANSATGQRAALLQEYMGYIQMLAPGQAGKLEPGEGETTQAIRRRLTAAAEALGKEL